jgi:hypothetical protein
MAIDHIIGYDCIPKQTLTTQGILERLKGEERAYTIIKLFREKGDDRPPDQMGFELTRHTPDGDEETQVIVVQDLLDQAEELQPLESHCEGCPANRLGRRFGCIDFMQYPVSAAAEKWLLDRLPVPDETLVWLLLKQGIKEFDYDGGSVEPLRQADSTYFEENRVLAQRLGEFSINTNQLFEMIFSVGNVTPNHAGILLLILNAIPRDLEADEIMKITPAGPDAEEKHPFLLAPNEDDDRTIREIKGVLHALYTAWRLNVPLILDV